MTQLRLWRRRGWGWTFRRIAVNAIVVVLMIIWFLPILGLFISSIRPQSELAASGWWTVLVAPIVSLRNWQEAIRVIGVGEGSLTSLAIAIPSTVLTVVLSAIGAFALARMNFRGRMVLSLLLVGLLVIPPQVTIVPLLRLFVLFGLNGSVAAVWIYQVGFTVPFGIFLVRGFMASIPDELFESAAADGASALQTFRLVAVPLCIPVLASLAILQFLWSWNDLLIPLIFLGGSGLPSPITVQAAATATAYGQDEGVMLAAAFLSIVLPLVILVALQRYFVRGILGGAVKG